MKNTTHKPAIELENLEKLTIIYSPLVIVGHHGFEGQVLKEQFCICEDAHGKATKTTKTVFLILRVEKKARMYKISSKINGYTTLNFFLLKLNQECEALFQYPKIQRAI